MLFNDVPVVIFGKESDRERFAILRLKDLIKLAIPFEDESKK